MHTNHRRRRPQDPSLREEDQNLNAAQVEANSPVPDGHGYFPTGRSKNHMNKRGSGFCAHAQLSHQVISAGVGFNFSNGHRGMAKAVRGAKKFVRSRLRFHENAAAKKLAGEFKFEDEI